MRESNGNPTKAGLSTVVIHTGMTVLLFFFFVDSLRLESYEKMTVKSARMHAPLRSNAARKMSTSNEYLPETGRRSIHRNMIFFCGNNFHHQYVVRRKKIKKIAEISLIE